jgi:hypothetical protein
LKTEWSEYAERMDTRILRTALELKFKGQSDGTTQNKKILEDTKKRGKSL